MKLEFSTTDVSHIFDMPVGRFREWLNNGYITPSVQQAEGPGTRNIFNFVDMILISVLKKLIESGLNRDSAAKYVKFLREDSNKQRLGFPIHENSVVMFTKKSNGEETIFTFKDGWGYIEADSLTVHYGTSIQPTEGKRDWEFALLVNIGKAVEEIEAKVINLWSLE